MLICKALMKHNIDHIFLYPGAKNIGILKAIKDSGITGHLCRHEQGCVFAAEGYAKSTNKIGVVLTTSGPGAANTISGIADAFSDSVPILILTTQVSIQSTGTEAFQEMPTLDMVKSITKSTYYVRSANDICHIFDHAFYLLKHERSRPIVIDIPSNIQDELGQYNEDIIHFKRNTTVSYADVNTFIQLLYNAQKPLICTGGGCKYGYEFLRYIMNKIGHIPCVSTVMGLGCYDGTNENFLGLMGMHGLYAANYAVNECDLLISLGARFCERATCNIKKFAPKAKIIHVDIDPSEIGKRLKTVLGICCDIRFFLETLYLELTDDKLNITDWCEQLQNVKAQYNQTRYIDNLNGQCVVYELDKYCKAHALEPIVTTGVGKHQVFTSQIFRHTNPWKWLTSGAFACMGFGIPAAIGASIANNKSTVVTIEGDGSILMNIQELATLYNEDLPVKIILFNNQILGLVEQIQETPENYTFLGCVHNQHDIYPDFNKIADGFMIRNSRVDDVSQLQNAFDIMFSDNKPYLLNVIIKDSYVRPEIMGGKSFNEIII